MAAVPARGRRTGLWIGIAAAVIVALAGASYVFMSDRNQAPQVVASGPSAAEKAAQDTRLAEEARRLKDQQELAKLRAEAAARDKAEQEAAQRRQIEDEARRKIEAEMAEKKRIEDEARQKIESEAAARQKAEEGERTAAEAAENAQHLTPLDRQHVQVALTSLGFDTNGSDGSFGLRTREEIAAWQKARNLPATGYLTASQAQTLFRESAPAIAAFDNQKKLEEARKKADEEKARIEAVPRAPPPASVPIAAAPGAAARSGPDGIWRGTLHCTPSRNGNEFTIPLVVNISAGTGTWTRPGAGPGTLGNQSVTVRITGQQVVVSRFHVPNSQPGVIQTATSFATYDGANSISGSGLERNGGGRTCQISLAR
jgi:peptidoglycan hydrolase-like protein with peptidoglycan-binding domain